MTTRWPSADSPSIAIRPDPGADVGEHHGRDDDAREVRASCTLYPKNAIVYTSCEFGFPEVMVMRPDGSRRERLTHDQVAYAAPAVSPDGARIAYDAFVDDILTIFVADADGSNARAVTTSAEGDQMPRWSPDGRQLVFQRSEGHVFRVYRIDADGGGATRLSTGAYHESWASWGPIL